MYHIRSNFTKKACRLIARKIQFSFTDNTLKSLFTLYNSLRILITKVNLNLLPYYETGARGQSIQFIIYMQIGIKKRLEHAYIMVPVFTFLRP